MRTRRWQLVIEETSRGQTFTRVHVSGMAVYYGAVRRGCAHFCLHDTDGVMCCECIEADAPCHSCQGARSRSRPAGTART